MDTVLAADLAKFGLDVETAIVALPHHAGRGGDVLLVGHRGRVKHHRTKAQRDRFGNQAWLGGVDQDERRLERLPCEPE
jgi:hypothetical protein